MGFDPILLLDEPPLSENYRVNIIRPGVEKGKEKEKKTLEDTQQETFDNSNTKNKKKDIIRLKNKNPIEQPSTNLEQTENINVDLDKSTNELINPDNDLINEQNELSSSESQEVNEDPRRKRRRSSASS